MQWVNDRRDLSKGRFYYGCVGGVQGLYCGGLDGRIGEHLNADHFYDGGGG